MAEEKGSLKWLWATLMIIGIIIFGFPLLFILGLRGFLGGGFSVWSFIALIPLAIVALLVWGLISLFSKKIEIGNKKAYKREEPERHMKVQYLFYIVGIIFVFVAVWYFAREYIAQFPRIIKLILLIVAIIVSYVIAEFMRGSDV
ncbi:MAG: hypothetical protein AABY16_03235 [Nanoarchaeota archaeon]